MEFKLQPIGKSLTRYPLMVIETRIGNNLLVLIDTGASMPVWIGELSTLLKFPGIIKAEYRALVGGFGGPGTSDDVYIIPDFVLTDGIEELHYLNLNIAYHPMDRDFQAILSFPMFYRLNAHIIYRSVSSRPSFIIDLPKSVHKVITRGIIRDIDGNQYLERVQILTQDTAESLGVTPNTTQLFSSQG